MALAKILTERMRKRLYWHHLPLLLLVSASGIALYLTRPYSDVITRLSFASAYPALALLSTTLLIGPWNALRKQKSPVSSDLRRDIGIWAGIVGLLHSCIGQCVHLRGRPWLYYIYEHRKSGPTGLRHDLFGFNNFTGLGAAIILIVLFATSNDLFLRRLGRRRWKQIQLWNYVCFALTGAHSIGYQVMERQRINFVAVVAVSLLLTLILQGTGFAVVRSGFRAERQR
jgi:methionine sulfoxide reductase heme-binding subunit